MNPLPWQLARPRLAWLARLRASSPRGLAAGLQLAWRG